MTAPPHWSSHPLLLAVMIVVVGLVFVFPAMQQPSNCGGNSEALSDVEYYALILRNAADDRPDHQFSISTATPREFGRFRELASAHPRRRYLVSPRPYREPPSDPKRIIIVCDRAYDNVPRPLIGRAPPAHAVAYADGSCGLISVVEFQKLDCSAFVPLDELLANAEAGN